MRRLVVAAGLACGMGASASAATFSYEGNAFDAFLSGPPEPAGPLTARVTFDTAAFAPGASLGASDITDFVVRSVPDSLTWTLAGATFVAAQFDVNAAGDGFDEWTLYGEQDLIIGNGGPEVFSINAGGLLDSELDEIVLADTLPVAIQTGSGPRGFIRDSPGTWSLVPIPLPPAGALLLPALAGMALLARKRDKGPGRLQRAAA